MINIFSNKRLVVSISFALLSIFLSAIYLHLRSSEILGGKGYGYVLIAKRDISPHTLLERGLVEKVKVPNIYIQPNAISSFNDLVGKVTISKISEGEQLVLSRLAVGGEKVGLSQKVSDSKRGVSLALGSGSSVGGLVMPDDRVDIVVRVDHKLHTLFEDVLVMAVGSRIHSLRNPEGIVHIHKKRSEFFGGEVATSVNRNSKKIFTFELDHQDSKKLILASSVGEVFLLLRAVGDRSKYQNLESVSIKDLGYSFLGNELKEYRGR